MGRYIPNMLNFWVVVFVSLGSTACSYGLAIMGSTLGQPSFYTSLNLAPPGTPGYSDNTGIIGAFNGVNSAGICIGAVFTAWCADLFSRKYSMQAGAAILVIGAGLCAGSVNTGMFVAARFIAGWGIGMLFTAIPMYQSEISTPETRGFMVSIHGIMVGVGYALSSWIGFGVYFITASGSHSSFPWRFPMAFQGAPVLLLLLGSWFLPFSPRWLMQKGRFDEAHKVLLRLHARKHDGLNDQVEKEFYQMRRQFEQDREVQKGVVWYEIFRTAPNRRRAMITLILMWGNQFTGTLILANYGVILFINLGLDGYMPLLLLGVWVTIGMLGNVFTALYIDRWGRRTFLLIGIAGIWLSLVLETVLQAKYSGTNNRAGLVAAVFFLFLFIVFWGSFMDATQFVYMTEIFPNHIRSQGTAWAVVLVGLASMIILIAGPVGLENIGWKFFFVFIAPTTLYWFAVYFWFPETRRQSLEEIGESFGEMVAVRYHGATEAEKQEYLQSTTHGGEIHPGISVGKGSGSEHVEIKASDA